MHKKFNLFSILWEFGYAEDIANVWKLLRTMTDRSQTSQSKMLEMG